MEAVETTRGVLIRDGNRFLGPGYEWSDLESCRTAFNSTHAAELVIAELQAKEADAVADEKPTKPVRRAAQVQGDSGIGMALW